MKNVLLTTFVLITALSFSQKTESLDGFEALDSNVGATINIMKSTEHKISISGDSDAVNSVTWDVEDKNLKIRSNRGNANYNNVVITVHTPSISVLTLADGGTATLDEKFSRLESFVASAADGATVDLSKIEFKNLVAQSSGGGRVIYKFATNLISNPADGGKVKGSR